MVLSELMKKKRDILAITGKHGARNVRVFGSVVKGRPGEKSDIDLLIELETGRSLMDHAAIILELEDLLGCKVDVAVERGLRKNIRDSVLLEAVPL